MEALTKILWIGLIASIIGFVVSTYYFYAFIQLTGIYPGAGALIVWGSKGLFWACVFSAGFIWVFIEVIRYKPADAQYDIGTDNLFSSNADETTKENQHANQ